METIEVSADVLLKDMFSQLGLPPPIYTNTGENCFDVTITFYPSMQHLQAALPPHSITSYPAVSMKGAVDIVARKAIRYMKEHQNKELKDYSYIELEYEKKRTFRLQNYVAYKNQKMARQTTKLKKTTIACDQYIDNVIICTQRIKKIITDGQASSCVALNGKPAASLADLHRVAADLTQHTQQVVQVLRALGMLPVNEPDAFDDDYSSGYASNQSEKDHYKCEALDYDSDGRHIDDEY